MGNEMYTIELLKELKTQNKRWFIAFIILVVLFLVVSVISVGIRVQMGSQISALENKLTEHCSNTDVYMETMLDYIDE